MANWTIRAATSKDAEALIRCIENAYAVYRPRIKDLPPVSEGIGDDIANNLVFVAVADDRVMGGLVLIPKSDHAVLANVAVDPGASGRGLGRALMEHAETECRRLGLLDIHLSTHVDMPDNVRLYEHLGWRRIGTSGNKVNMARTLQKHPSASGAIDI